MKEKLEGKERAPRRLAALAAAAVLAAALVPAAAMAAPAEATHDTDVKLYKESDQVTVVVPTAIPAAIAGANGSFVTAGNAKFENEGVFPVHVSKIGVKTATGVSLVAKAAFDSTTNVPSAIWSTVTPGSGQEVDLSGHTTAKAPDVLSQWNIGGGSDLPITLAGAMKDPGAAFTSATNAANAALAFTVTWTVASGEAI